MRTRRLVGIGLACAVFGRPRDAPAAERGAVDVREGRGRAADPTLHGAGPAGPCRGDHRRGPGAPSIDRCTRWGSGFEARWELSRGRAPSWARWVARPPDAVREVGAALGLRPAILARWVAPLDPWAGWTLAQAEANWQDAERLALPRTSATTGGGPTVSGWPT